MGRRTAPPDPAAAAGPSAPGRAGAGDDSWGPSVEGRSRPGRRFLRRLVILWLILSLVAAVAVPLAVSARIPRVPVDGIAASATPFNVLVVGSDARDELTREQMIEWSTGTTVDGERTDTIFLMQIHRGEVALLAFPRDLWVERCDGSIGRINVAQGLGGPGCLVETVSQLSGIDIHAYTGVGFAGFVDIVEALDGVELCLENAINDRDANIDLPAGCQRLGGADALGFVRVRKIDNDLERIRRQQQFVRALAREIASPSVLLNPVALWRLSDEIGDAVVMDDGVGVLDLGRMAWGAWGLASGDLVAHTVPADPGTTSGGAAVLFVRETEAEALFSSFRTGAVLGTVGSDLAPADVRVNVLNGARVHGLAGQVGELLSGRGYQVVDVGNADERETSVVRYPPGARAAAALVAGDLPGSPALEESRDVAVVTVVLGRDAAGAA